MTRLRIGHFGDLHLNEANRFEDTLACFDRGIDDALSQEVNLFAIAGDIFERKSLPIERNEFASRLIKMADFAPVVIVRGNHDVPGDLNIFAQLSAEHTIIVSDRPISIMIDKSRTPIHVHALPFPQKSYFMTKKEALSIDESNAQAREILLQVVAGFARANGKHPDVPSILVGHINVVGSEASTGQIMIGGEIELSPYDLATAGANAYLMSHIHKHQEIVAPGLNNAAYCGSINHHNYGETEEKGYLLWTINGDDVTHEFRNVHARKMILVDMEWGEMKFAENFMPEDTITEADDGRHGWIADNMPQEKELDGADIRLRYKVPEDMASEVNEQKLKGELSGAHSLKIEKSIIPRAHIRSEAISKAKSPADKLEAYWEHNEKPDEKTAEGCLTKLGLMETESREQIIDEIQKSQV